MLISDLIEVSNENRLIEIANPTQYYYGLIKDIPEWLKDFKIVYLAAGNSDSTGEPNVLLVDAEPRTEFKLVGMTENNDGSTTYSIQGPNEAIDKLVTILNDNKITGPNGTEFDISDAFDKYIEQYKVVE